jgi:hypothetical protein
MSDAPILNFDARTPVPDLSVLELAVIICVVRGPGHGAGAIASNLARWFNVALEARDLASPLLRLERRGWLVGNDPKLEVSEEARTKSEFAARGIVQLLFRDRYFFDVGKLLDVSIVREDHIHEK